jgi:putative PIN family toxin of toxin-antitoxin system
MRVVLDTNVIISRYLTPQGRVARVVGLWERGELDVVTSEPILHEYARVLRYPYQRNVHGFSETELAEIEVSFEEFTDVVTPAETPAVIEADPDDDHILAAADTARVDCIVSGDKHLLQLGWYKGIPILSPAEFLTRFFPD